jgi:uncharacterized membrane protein
MSEQKEKTSMGLEPNLAGLLCYVVGWINGLIFFLAEKENKSVRFHAMQSIVTFGTLTIAGIIISFIPFVGWIIGWLIWVLAIVLWIVLMIKAYQGEMFKLPWAGSFAEKQAGLK